MMWSSGMSGLKPSKINKMFEAIRKSSDKMQKLKKTHVYLNETNRKSTSDFTVLGQKVAA